MGYRSDWKLAFTGKPLQLHLFMEWWESQVDKNLSPLEQKEMIPYILKCADDSYTDIEHGIVILDGSGWKCYHEFEAAIQTIRDTARDDFSLETSYARIGEETTDIECESDGDMYIGVSVIIDHPECAYDVSDVDTQEYQDYLEAKKGRPVPEDKVRWEDITNE